mmetsp:Transcript_16634/g.56731  ORF Transcript_16634/g.56731 Transcript_16634/m.56731 type:complete len:224 (-) Transcript_16634:252-923(-)
MITFPSWPQLASVFIGSPTLGAHATHLTQSVCPTRGAASSAHVPVCSLQTHSFTRLSQPQDASRRTGACGAAAPTTSDPGGVAGAHDTLMHPTLCAPGTFCSDHVPSSALWLITLRLPSLLAHASMSPTSCGAQHTLFTEASCSVGGEVYTGCHTFSAASFQMRTVRSKEHDASSAPNLGWLQHPCHTGPSWPTRSHRNVCDSALTSNSLMRRSELQVASRFP